MLLINIPHVVGWLMFYMAQSTNELFIGAFIFGLGGFISPSITYDGEICQPKWRGLLSSATGKQIDAFKHLKKIIIQVFSFHLRMSSD